VGEILVLACLMRLGCFIVRAAELFGGARTIDKSKIGDIYGIVLPLI
jgi:hypothetical protein